MYDKFKLLIGKHTKYFLQAIRQLVRDTDELTQRKIFYNGMYTKILMENPPWLLPTKETVCPTPSHQHIEINEFRGMGRMNE